MSENNVEKHTDGVVDCNHFMEYYLLITKYYTYKPKKLHLISAPQSNFVLLVENRTTAIQEDCCYFRETCKRIAAANDGSSNSPLSKADTRKALYNRHSLAGNLDTRNWR